MVLCTFCLAGAASAAGYKSEADCTNADGTRYTGISRWSQDRVAATRQQRGQPVDYVFVACNAPGQISIANPVRENSRMSPLDIIDAALAPGSKATTGDLRETLVSAGYDASLRGFAVKNCLCPSGGARKMAVPRANTTRELDPDTVERLRKCLLGSGNF